MLKDWQQNNSLSSSSASIYENCSREALRGGNGKPGSVGLILVPVIHTGTSQHERSVRDQEEGMKKDHFRQPLLGWFLVKVM